MIVAEALDLGARRLQESGVAAAEWDAERLLRHVLGWSAAHLLTRAELALSAENEAAFFRLVAERAGRRPLQHLVGTQSFWHHELIVSPDVLIPRPETELLVETALGILEPLVAPRIVDVGTGTGAIALSLAAELPQAEVHATEISAAALAVARTNAKRLQLSERVQLHLGDLLEPVASMRGQIDLVVSNPPYVDASELATLEPEVRDHEPRIALVPPGGPLAMYSRLVSQAVLALRRPGWLAVELGAGMSQDVRNVFAAGGFERIRRLPDLQGIERVLVGSLC
jgi:release factor glutamine methyltransferase